LAPILASEAIIKQILKNVEFIDLDPSIPTFIIHCYAWGKEFNRNFDLVHDESKPIKYYEEKLSCLMAKDGTCCFDSMVRLSPGSTKPGGQVILSW
jgi:hypothetical protein